LGIIALLIIAVVVFSKMSTRFDYKGVKFDMVQEGELILYHTDFPIMYINSQDPTGLATSANYNIYLRNDPRELEKTVPAIGTLVSIEDTVVNITKEFECEGKQMIAIANLNNLYGAIGKKFISDENAACDPLGRYMYVVIQSGNETSVEQFGPRCYNINIKDCEILEGTERFIIGMLVNINLEQSKAEN
jgi:hypothetical protein